MKRLSVFLFLYLIAYAGTVFAQSTLPVIPFGERKADLYYWDTNWIDRYEHLHPNSTPYPVSMINNWYYDRRSDVYWGRACQANTPMVVRGIAGMAKTVHLFEPMFTIDTNRLPEWFIMYDTNYNKLGEGRWDTLEPNYKMEVKLGNGRDSIDVYEVYFDKPILVSGRFYIGGTTHNNLCHGMNTGDENYSFGQPEHLATFYPDFNCNASITTPPYMLPCNPPVALVHYYWPYIVAHPPANYDPSFDTSSFQLVGCQYHFYPFFAIIDTDYVYYDCQMPTGLGVIEADMDSITVSWDSSEAEMWEVLLWADGTVPDSGMLFGVETNRLTLYGLDTSLRYNVKVMSVCDTFHINTSPWSSVFGFRVSDYIVRPCPVPEGLRVQTMATAGSVVARWDNSDVGLWELALWSDGGGDTILLQSAVEYLDVDGLDTARWYSAMVRAWCDSTNVSEWSDTVRFYVPNPNPGGDDPEGIEDAIGQHTYLMPNPTDGKVTVLSSYRLRKVELFGSDGKPVAAYEADGHSATLDLSAYPAGTYVVRVTTSAGVTNKRLVKK